MLKKNGFWVMLLAVLAAGMFLLGCPTETEDEKDTWRPVRAEDNLAGTWKGSFSQPSKPLTELIPASEMEKIPPQFADLFKDINIAMSGNITVNISDTKAVTTELELTATFSGKSIETFWEFIEWVISSGFIPQGWNVTPDPKEHSITMTSPPQSGSLGDFPPEGTVIEINQNATKLRMKQQQPDGITPEEIILVKQ